MRTKLFSFAALLFAASASFGFDSLTENRSGRGVVRQSGFQDVSVRQVRVALARNGKFTISFSGPGRLEFTGDWRQRGSSQVDLDIDRAFGSDATGRGSLQLTSRDKLRSLAFSGEAGRVRYSVDFTADASDDQNQGGWGGSGGSGGMTGGWVGAGGLGNGETSLNGRGLWTWVEGRQDLRSVATSVRNGEIRFSNGGRAGFEVVGRLNSKVTGGGSVNDITFMVMSLNGRSASGSGRIMRDQSLRPTRVLIDGTSDGRRFSMTHEVDGTSGGRLPGLSGDIMPPNPGTGVLPSGSETMRGNGRLAMPNRTDSIRTVTMRLRSDGTFEMTYEGDSRATITGDWNTRGGDVTFTLRRINGRNVQVGTGRVFRTDGRSRKVDFSCRFEGESLSFSFDVSSSSGNMLGN